MNSKLFELRDRATFVPVLAVQLIPFTEQDYYLLRRSGYGLNEVKYPVMLTGLSGGIDRATSDPYEWADRTRQVAHTFIAKHFDELESGQVIDVEFILGESKSPKQSESITNYTP